MQRYSQLCNNYNISPRYFFHGYFNQVQTCVTAFPGGFASSSVVPVHQCEYQAITASARRWRRFHRRIQSRISLSMYIYIYIKQSQSSRANINTLMGYMYDFVFYFYLLQAVVCSDANKFYISYSIYYKGTYIYAYMHVYDVLIFNLLPRPSVCPVCLFIYFFLSQLALIGFFGPPLRHYLPLATRTRCTYYYYYDYYDVIPFNINVFVYACITII